MSNDPTSNYATNVKQAPTKSPLRGPLMYLVPLALAATAAYFVVPNLLVQIYHAEEEAKARSKNIVGTKTDAVPPPGKSTDPYAGLMNRGGGGAGGGAGGGGAGGGAESEGGEAKKPADDAAKESGEAKSGDEESKADKPKDE